MSEDLDHLRPDLAGFQPSPAQALAKARLQAALQARAGLVDTASLTAQELVAWSGDARVARWLRDPAFATWLTDREDFVHKATALKDTAVAVLQDILLGDLEPKVLTAGDKLKAIDLLFKLTGSYPRAQLRFGDRELDAMDEAEVDRQLQLATTKGPAK